jgi:tRNA threonylcarbamoyladenosine biosynthesis protein TsaE
MKSFVTRSPEETVDLGCWIAGVLRPGDVVAITGELGTGKTQLVLGICRGLDVRKRVTSPTFTFIHEYTAPFGTVVHVDLYRVTSSEEVAGLGIEEYFNERCICLIEWAERVQGSLPKRHYTVRMSQGSHDDERMISIEEMSGVSV